mmetsp:Transcript_20794/g.30799  ORF Transcript_20794/g.30799 Transcript_20794/m.30799 type:complete len:170 (-) Transcript_20794:168-677(-)
MKNMNASHSDRVVDIGRTRSGGSGLLSNRGFSLYGVEFDPDGKMISPPKPVSRRAPLLKNASTSNGRRVRGFMLKFEEASKNDDPSLAESKSPKDIVKRNDPITRSASTSVILDPKNESNSFNENSMEKYKLHADNARQRRIKRQESKGLLNKRGLYGIVDSELKAIKD